MAFENAEVKILSNERVLDTDPELYKRRALDALSKQYYLDAMAEADKAIQYGYNWPRYQAVKARVLLATEKYNECMMYLLKGSDLWKRKDDSIELSNEDKDFVRYAFSVCYGQLGYPPEKLPEIILTADGRGMCKSIQEAVDKYSDKKIFLTGGVYSDNLVSEKKDITIIGSYYNRPVVNGYWSICDGNVNIKSLDFVADTYKEYASLHLIQASFSLESVNFRGNGNVAIKNGIKLGLYIKDNKVRNKVSGVRFENLVCGLQIVNSDIEILNNQFLECRTGIAIMNEKPIIRTMVKGCHFEKNGVAVLSGFNGIVELIKSEFYMNEIAVGATKMYEKGLIREDGNGGFIKIKDNCEIIGSIKTMALINNNGQIYIENSLMKNNYQEFVDDGTGYFNKRNVTEKSNTSAGPLKEGVKSIFKALFS